MCRLPADRGATAVDGGGSPVAPRPPRAYCKDRTFSGIQGASEKFLQDYQQAFVRVFGQPAANQTWGFGQPANARMTRGHDANANEWADITEGNPSGHGGWLVTAPLTPGQKLRVKAYFQNNRLTNGEAIDYKNFFVQQVYKGGAETAGENSPESYRSGSGAYYDSDGMNLLCAGNGEHINNFNGGTYGVEKDNYGREGDGYVNVLDNYTDRNSFDDNHHEDQIMLMVNSSTAYFGYHNANVDYQHNDKFIIISAATIDTWADSPTGGNGIGEAVTDSWNRYFVGFDYEMRPVETAYVKDGNGDYMYFNVENMPNFGQPLIYENGECKMYDLDDPIWHSVIEVNGIKAAKVTSDLNQYYVDSIRTFKDDDFKEYGSYKDENGAVHSNQPAINLDFVKNLIENGWHPLSSDNKTWVKMGDGAADHYYSDWIICVTEGKTYDKIPSAQPSLRVIAEDLSAEEAGDFDFNDVVFDVVRDESGTFATVTVRAAGGTLPLYLNGKEVHGLFSNANPGATTDQGGAINTATMINTNAKRINPETPYSSAELSNLPTFTVTDTWSADQDTFAGQVRDLIKVTVDKEGAAGMELKAEAGKTPGKVGVPTTYTWKEEKVYIGDNFKKFVGDASYKWWE